MQKITTITTIIRDPAEAEINTIRDTGESEGECVSAVMMKEVNASV